MSLAARVWCPDGSDEDGATDVMNEKLTPREAAVAFAERRYDQSDYPEEQDIHVRDEAGVLHIFTVEAARSVEFTAYRWKADR